MGITSRNETSMESSKSPSVWSKMLTSQSDWPDKDEFLDVIYWMRQILGIILGLVWGLLPLTGIFGLASFFVCNAGIVYLYFNGFQKVDEEEFGGAWELTKEGFMTSLAGFLVTWIIIYSGLHFSEQDLLPFPSS